MDPVQRLYAVPLEDFVAERKQVTRELRAAGEKDRAAELAKLPKPTPPAWALNALARERPDVIAAWAEVADALRDASADPGPGLRDAMAAHREATTQLVRLVGEEVKPGGKPLSEPMLTRVRTLLQEATVDAGRAERLREGLVVEGGGGDGAEPAAAPRAAATKRAAGTAGKEEDEEAVRRAQEDAEREAEARRDELRRSAGEAAERAVHLREEAADRAHAAADAAERLEEAQRVLLRTESESEAAQEAAGEARDAAADAARKAEVLAAQLRDAGG